MMLGGPSTDMKFRLALSTHGDIFVTICEWMMRLSGNMDPHARRQWLMLLDAQGGIVDRSQAKQAGFSDRQIWHRLRSGRWQRVHEGVYAHVHRPAAARGACCGRRCVGSAEGAMLSHETAAEVHGLVDAAR